MINILSFILFYLLFLKSFSTEISVLLDCIPIPVPKAAFLVLRMSFFCSEEINNLWQSDDGGGDNDVVIVIVDDNDGGGGGGIIHLCLFF